MKRTHNNSELNSINVGEHVVLKGWVKSHRLLGGLLFIDLRDIYGITQLVVRPDSSIFTKASKVKNEYVIEVHGTVIMRERANDHLATGNIEVEVENIVVIGTSETTPLIIDDVTDALEDTRLKYRYLDLRRPIMQQKFKLRHKMNKSFRNFFDDEDFIEIETPIFMKPTPEGARDYLVASRVHQGEFFALPQSPQMMKQLLMISGFEKYYQIARCFRDEDLRADRQPEFTQLDLEMSFVDQEDIFSIMEKAVAKMMLDTVGVQIKTPFQRLTFDETMERFGIDKPDLRFGMELKTVSDIFTNSEFSVFREAKTVRAINVVGSASDYSRKDIDRLTDFVKRYKAQGLAWLKYNNDQFSGPIAKFLSEKEKNDLAVSMDIQENDLILFVADSYKIANDALGNLRNLLAKELSLLNADEYAYAWITEWPLFEVDDDTGALIAAHHPFTKVRDEDVEKLDKNPEKAYAQAYDLVLNGFELGSGSIRINDPILQGKMFEIMGFSKEEAQQQFGFLIDAYKFGAPNHAGIALGLDRIAMILTNSDSIREVIAFPKTASTRDLMSDAPVKVGEQQLNDLHIEIKK